MAYRSSTCERNKPPGPTAVTTFGLKHENFGDCLGYDLFTLADVRGTNQSFLNQVDMSSSLQVVAPVDSYRLDVIAEKTMDSWQTPFGIPSANRTDGGGEFEAEFADLMDSLGVKPLKSAACSPTNSAPIGRAGGAWKYVARMAIDGCQLVFDKPWKAKWLCVVTNWTRNSEPDETGCLAVGIKLPFDAMSPAAVLRSCRGVARRTSPSA